MTALTRLRRWIAVVLPMTAAMLLLSSQTAHATDYFNIWKWTTKKYVMTHSGVYENNGSTTLTYTVVKEHSTTVTASITLDVGATAGMGKFMTKLGAEVGLSLHGEGSKTKTSSITIQASIPAHKTYVFYSGTRRAEGLYQRWGCSSSRCSVVGKKQGKSWNTRYDGNYQCGLKAKTPLAKLAKLECP